jgi:hypothetical protein
MANKTMRGKITEVRGTPNPNSYIIEDENEQTYLVHVGDIKNNEQLLYSLYTDGKTAKLQLGDEVEFQSDTHGHAIHVKKT